jgi:hypothetical protein
MAPARTLSLPPSFLVVVATLALVLSAAGGAVLAPRADAGAIAGCYAFATRDQRGTPFDRIVLDTAFHAEVWRLYGVRAMRARWMRSAPDQSALETMFWVRSWGNSIRLVVTTGFFGIHMDLAPDGSDLVGETVYFGDVVQDDPPPPAPLRARRIPCTAA